MFARALSFFLFNFFLTKIIVVRILFANFFEPIHFCAILASDLAKELGDFKFLVFLKKISMLRLEVEVDARIGCEYLVTEARVDPRQGIAQRRNAALT